MRRNGGNRGALYTYSIISLCLHEFISAWTFDGEKNIAFYCLHITIILLYKLANKEYSRVTRA